MEQGGGGGGGGVRMGGKRGEGLWSESRRTV